MNRKAIDMKYVIAIIIGLVFLTVMLVFMFASPGGPSNLSQSLLDFMDTQTTDIESMVP